MGTSLYGLTPAATYQGLIKFGDNSALTATQKVLSDGNGNNLPISVGTNAVTISGASTGATPITLTVDNTLGYTPPYDQVIQKWISGGVQRAIMFADGDLQSTYLTSNSTFTAKSNSSLRSTTIKGTGSTSATTSLLVQNSGGTDLARLTDDGTYRVGNVTMSGQRFASVIGDLEFNLLGGYSMRFLSAGSEIARYSWNGNWNFGTAYTPDAKINIRTSGTSSATKAFLVENSYVAKMFCVNDAGQVSLQTVTPHASALFQIDSTGQGMLPPRMTDAQVRAIATPAVGLTCYNTDLDCPVFYSTAGWRKISHSAM